MEQFKKEALEYISLIEESFTQKTSSSANKYINKAFSLIDKYANIDGKIKIFQAIYNNTNNSEILTNYLAGSLSIYEPIIAKELYMTHKEIDPIISLILNNWEEDQKTIQKENREEIDKYNKWKKENNFNFIEKNNFIL